MKAKLRKCNEQVCGLFSRLVRRLFGRLVRHSVEWTVEDMIARYPDLFQSRTQALHHLFVVLGCGYRWKNGKLIETYRECDEDRIPRSAARILARHRTKLERELYPYLNSCNLATMPPDAGADWKAAAEEARADLSTARDRLSDKSTDKAGVA